MICIIFSWQQRPSSGHGPNSGIYLQTQIHIEIDSTFTFGDKNVD